MKKRIAEVLSLFDLSKMFSTEDEAVAWFEKYRWAVSRSALIVAVATT